MPGAADHAELKNKPRSIKRTGKREVQGEGANRMEFIFQLCDPKTDMFHKEHLNPALPGELKWLP